MPLSLLADIGGRRGDLDYADLTRDNLISGREKDHRSHRAVGIIRLSA